MTRSKSRLMALAAAVVGIATLGAMGFAFREEIVERTSDFLEDAGFLESGKTNVTRSYPVSELVRKAPGMPLELDRFEEGGSTDGLRPEDDLHRIQRLVDLVTVELKDENWELVGDEVRFRDGKLSVITTSERQRKVRAVLAALRRLGAQGRDPLEEAPAP